MLSGRRGERALLAALAALSYGLAFLQRPGETVTDTRIELSVDPALFLERSAWIWSTTTDLGHVQSGQFTGYLFPMGPWFALGDWLGLPMWVTQRLWLGTLLFLAGWGAIRLMRALFPAAGRVGEAGAALVFALSPYVVLYTSRGTVTLLAYAALPWLMLAVHRGLRDPRGWYWPAAIGLLLAASGGGVNAAVIALALLGPLALLVYELLLGDVDRRAAWSFTWRAALAGALASAWWAFPLLLQSGYGADFLLFTEHPRSIWATTSLPELLRQLGFWGLYVGVGVGRPVPFMGVADTYLYSVPVILATFALPLLAVLSFRAARTWRYAPFFLALAVLTLVVMFAGFPDGTRLRQALIDLYNNFAALQFLRTTYKAAPVLVLSFACLIGAGVATLAGRARTGALVVLAVVALVAAAPLVAGDAIDSEQVYGDVPSWWEESLADADAAQPSGTRTMVIPGELFGWYRWGGTTSPVAPAIARRPVAIREIVPYADARSAQLQIAVDDLVQQARLVPGQLPPLLRLMDVGQVLVPTDGLTSRNGATDPARVERALARQPGLDRGVQSYGPRLRFVPPAGRGGAGVTLPAMSRRDPPGAPAPGGARLHPAGGATVLSGDAEGVPALAATGLLDPTRALFYAADLEGAELRRSVRDGARLVFSDSARRRVFVSSRTRANRGPTLGPEDPIPPDYARFDTFPEAGPAGQTVARLRRRAAGLQPGGRGLVDLPAVPRLRRARRPRGDGLAGGREPAPARLVPGGRAGAPAHAAARSRSCPTATAPRALSRSACRSTAGRSGAWSSARARTASRSASARCERCGCASCGSRDPRSGASPAASTSSGFPGCGYASACACPRSSRAARASSTCRRTRSPWCSSAPPPTSPTARARTATRPRRASRPRWWTRSRGSSAS